MKDMPNNRVLSWLCNRCVLSEMPFFSCNIQPAQQQVSCDFIQDSITKLNTHRNHLSVAHLNTQSISSTFTQFEAMLKSHEFDVITLSETWLKDNSFLLNHVQIPGYQFGFRNRDRIKGGGVGYYIKTTIKFKERKDISVLDNTIEHQWIEISHRNKNSNILIGTLYQPSSNSNEKTLWLEKFDNLLSQVVPQHEGPIIITGDFNINLKKSTNVANAYVEILETYNLIQQVPKPTRHGTALIDHIITNQMSKLIHADVVPCDEISDHDAPFCIFKIKPNIYEPRFKYVRDERSLSMKDFVEDFSLLPFSVVYGVDDISDKIDVLNTLITDCIDKHAPLRRVKLTRPPAPWMKDLNIAELQRERNHLRKKVHTYPTNENWNFFRTVRNKLKSEIAVTKQNFFKKLLMNKSSKIVWKTINKILHPNPKNINVDPDAINQFFNDTATRTTGKNVSPRYVIDNMIQNLAEQPESFHLHPVTYKEVMTAIRSLRLDSSTGPDNIPAKYVKNVAEFIVSPITHILNCCIDSSTFPEQWKISRICPIPKNNNPTDLVDYRPISVLPILSKVFERLILNQITEYIESKAVYHQEQSGFRKGHSTTTILHKLKDDILTTMKKGEVTLSIFADFSKAFDTVDYPTLINRLNNLGFSKKFIKLINDYLTNRYQFVQIDDKASRKLSVKFGVPQGSILGPVLFNLYVTQLSSNGSSTYLQYADDTTLLRHTKPKALNETIESMQKEMDSIFQWSTKNNLQLNATKTKLMLFSTKQMSRAHKLEEHDIYVTSNNKYIQRVDSFKILGVHFNNHLTWNNHVNSIIKSGFVTLKTLKQFKRLADFKLKKSLAECLVLSKISYCNTIFSNVPNYLIRRLQKLQRASVSFILNRYCDDTDVIGLHWLPVEESMALSIVKLAHKAVHNNENWPSYLKLKFNEVPQRILRANVTQTIQSNDPEGTFSHTAATHYNDLPCNIRRIEEYFTFCNEAKKFYFDKATARILSQT
jgi:exonuclease III